MKHELICNKVANKQGIYVMNTTEVKYTELAMYILISGK